MVAKKPLVSLRALEYQSGIKRARLEEIAACAGALYRPFDREKKPNSNRWRHIDNPAEPLKGVQRRLARTVFRDLELPTELTGGLRGRSIAHNARPHLGQPVVVAIDLENFFPHLNNGRVFDCLRRHLGCSTEIAGLLTRLTTFQGRLPQGSPASTFLANLALIDPLSDLKRIAVERGLNLSCFVDDITYSGPGADGAIQDAIGVLSAHGLKVARDKIKIMREHQTRVVTGQSVSRRLGMPRRWMSQSRAFLSELLSKATILEAELARAQGLVEYASSVNVSQGEYLRRLLVRIAEPGDDSRSTHKAPRTRPCNSYRRRH